MASQRDILGSLSGMRSAVGKRVLGLTNRLAAASPTMVNGLPIYDLSHPAGGEAAEPGRSSGVGGSSGDILANEDGGGAYMTVGDATVVIQSGPSPPVFEDPRSKGGVSRDWGIIFDVYREDYASKMESMMSSLDEIALPGKLKKVFGSAVLPNAKKEINSGKQAKAQRKEEIADAQDPIAGSHCVLLRLFEEVSEELRRGRSLCEAYRKAHAKATDGYWRFQESIKRAADDERLLAKAAAEREQRIAMKRKLHLALEAEELIQNAQNERVQMQARQAAAFFTADLRAKLKKDLQGLSVASVEIEQTLSGLQQQAMRIKAVIDSDGGGGGSAGGGAAGGVQGENEGVIVVLRGMLRLISDFLIDNVGPFRGLRDMANGWAKEGIDDKEKDGCGIPPEFIKELGCASPDSSPGGGKAKTGPPRRPPPPPPPEESDDDDDEFDDGEDTMMEAVEEEAVAAVLEELGVGTSVVSVSEGCSADVARGGDGARGGHLRDGGRQEGLDERERERGGDERGMEDDGEEEGEGEMLARLLGGASLDGDEEGEGDEAKAVDNQLDLLEALLGPDD